MQKKIDDLLQPTKIPMRLGKCEILKVHDDGDVTAECGGKKFVITTEGEIFEEVGIGYYGALVGEIFKKYLKKEITHDQFTKETKTIEEMFRGGK